MLTLATLQAQEISSEFPFTSNYVNVLGSKIHYVDEYEDISNPDQLTFLFLHGNPTSSYLWRNIIPYVKDQGRAIAPDLIGMGKSDKPDIAYTLQDHITYLDAFIEAKKLKNIVLVLHDWGSGLGFNYAFRNEHNIKSIVFMEAITKPISWKEVSLPERILFKRFRDDKKGHKMIAENNFFINKFLFKFGVNRKFSTIEKNYYNYPFPTVESRKPIKVWPKEIPIDGIPARNHTIITDYSIWLKETNIPKLLLYAKPGMIIKKKDVEKIQNEFKNIEAIYIGKGKHYLQEDHPHEIGNSIKDWVKKTQL